MPKLTEAQVLSRSRAASLDNVKKLNCWASKIDDITIITKLNNVEIVNLSCNAIRTLEPFRHCDQMRELYVRRNNIHTLSEIQYLRGLEALRNLWLADNPCTDCDHYRLTVIKTLPNLEKLDNQAISDEEREAAQEQGLDLDSPVQQSTPEQSGALVNGESTQGDGDHLLSSLEETNQLRVTLGLKPVTAEKHTPSEQDWSQKSKSSNTLQAVLLLLETLDDGELQQVQTAVRDRLAATTDDTDENLQMDDEEPLEC